MTDTDKIEKLIQTTEFQELQTIGTKLYNEKKQFDLLSVFNELINENAWSRIFAYIFDSKREHGLKQSALREWLKEANMLNESLNFFLNQIPKEDECETITITEWQTEYSRRIDILIKIQDTTGNTKAVIGIENKVDSGEQLKQISDYQKALIQNFKKIPKLLFFLTPDGRNPQTSRNYKECPCVSYSYKSIVSVCNKLIPQSNGQGQIFVSALKNHIDKLLKSNSMEQSIRTIIHKLYENPDYREGIKLIGQHIPNINYVLDELQKYFNETPFKELHLPITEKFDIWIGGRNAESKEFNLQLNNSPIKNKNIYPIYMLHYDGKTSADVGDEFLLRIMLYKVKSESKRNKILDFTELPNSLGNKKHWSPWVNIWVGDSYRLVDLGDKDVKGLTNLLCNGIRQTYFPLKKKLQKLSQQRLT